MSKIAEECEDYRNVLEAIRDETGNPKITLKRRCVNVLTTWQEHRENGTRGAVVIMPIREGKDSILGAPYPEKEAE